MIQFKGIDHHSILVSDIQQSINFYHCILGLEVDEKRPAKLPFKGAWFVVGHQSIHALELPNPDAHAKRPEHGGRDRHVALRCRLLQPLINALEAHNIAFTRSQSGRAAIFFRDPDGNAIEVMEE